MSYRNIDAIVDALRPYLRDTSPATILFVYETLQDLAETEYSRGASVNLRKYDPNEDGYVQVSYDRY